MANPSTITFNLRVPEDLDDVVEKVAGLEFRKKNAVISLALTEYVSRHHPGLMKTRSMTNNNPTGKEAAE